MDNHWTSLTEWHDHYILLCYTKSKRTNTKTPAFDLCCLSLFTVSMFCSLFFHSDLTRLLLSPIPVLGPLLPELFFLACCGVTWQHGGLERWWDGRFKRLCEEKNRGMDIVFPTYQLHYDININQKWWLWFEKKIANLNSEFTSTKVRCVFVCFYVWMLRWGWWPCG